MNFSVDISALDEAGRRIRATGSTVGSLGEQVEAPSLSCFGKFLEPAASITFPGATDDGRDFLSALAEADEAISKKVTECAQDYANIDEAIAKGIAAILKRLDGMNIPGWLSK
ncbi:MAG: hypothetical protein Q4D79_14475 [Propionibacteriaceae bacterium]|nr:hypothetical protein [Propionibacteriaceae bacterium]